MRVFALTVASALALTACAPATTAPAGTASPAAGMPSASPTTPAAGATAAPEAPAGGPEITVDGTKYAPVGTAKALYGVGKNERMAIYAGNSFDARTPGQAHAVVALKGELAAGFTVANVDEVENFIVDVLTADGKAIGYRGLKPRVVSNLVIDASTGTIRGTFTDEMAAYDDKGKRIGTDVHKVVYRFDAPFPAAQ